MNNSMKYFKSIINLIVYTGIGYIALMTVQSSQTKTAEQVRYF